MYNDSNNPTLAPFYATTNNDGTIVLEVEADTYDRWAQSDELVLVQKEFDKVVRVDGPVSKLTCDSIADCPDWFITVYRALLTRGNAERWWRETVFRDGIVPIENTKASVAAAIQTVMDNHPEVTAWFCKVGTRSTKHECPVQPVVSGTDAVDHLWGAKIVRETIEDGTARCVCLRPWDDRIDPSNELRVFCRDGRVVGVSQQACYSMVPALHLFAAEDMVAAAQQCYDDFTAKLPPQHRFPGECTFDAFLTTDSAGEVEIHLIEINAGMFGWGPAGAALFHWVLEPPPPPDDGAVFYVH